MLTGTSITPINDRHENLQVDAESDHGLCNQTTVKGITITCQ